jgi:hypothetical protein
MSLPAAGEAGAVVEAQAKQVLDLLECPSELLGSSSSTLSTLDPQILQAFLAGSSWAESFDAFFLEHSGIFADFAIGAEHTFQQTAVHSSFVRTAEGLLEGVLAEKAVSADRFLAQVMADADGSSGIAAIKPAAAVMRRLEEALDFQQFGLMMRQRHERVFSRIGQLEQSRDSLQAQIDMARARAQQPRAFAQIEQLEQARRSLQAQIDEAKAQAQQKLDADELAFEQRSIRDASERRRRAREDAMRRAAETALDLDDETERVPPAEPVSALVPEPEPELHTQAQTQTAAPGSFGGWSSWQSHPAREVAPGWEVGTVETGVVSYWDPAGWGKIKRMAVGGKLNSLGIPQIGDGEIFVHNLQLPMDSPKRWLRRGEAVQFTVGVTLAPKGPQAMAVVGVGADGEPGAALLCQQPPLL